MTDLVDSHAHIQSLEFDADRDETIERARAAGVATIIVPAENVESAVAAITLAEKHEGVFATAGFHPHEAKALDEAAFDRLGEMLAHEKVVAVGEIGLDFYRMLSPREDQISVFLSQLYLASAWRLPVVVHCRDAWDILADTLAPWAEEVRGAYKGRPLGVLHYFSADIETALRYINLGFLVSIHTSVTHPKATELRRVAAALPMASLLVETDSPYGAPQAHRGKRNEPAFVIEAAEQIALLRGVPVEEVAAATTANASRLFGLQAVTARRPAGAKA